MKNLNYLDRMATPADFARAFRYSLPLLKLMVMSEAADRRLTGSQGNDIVAALLQARDLVAACAEAGLEVTELTKWVGEWGREWKEQEILTATSDGAQNHRK